MKTNSKHNERIAKMTFSSIYPHYIKKVKDKGRTEKELNKVIEWLTGFNHKDLIDLINEEVSFEFFLRKQD